MTAAVHAPATTTAATTPQPAPGSQVVSTFDWFSSALIFRHQCWCGLQSTWRDSPEAALADRPANCRAHDDTPTPSHERTTTP